MRRQPLPVLSEVGTDRAHQHRPQPQAAQVERDVGGRAATADRQVFHQEGQREVRQLIRHDLLGKPAREDHQVIGSDRPRDDDAHHSLPETR
jgi:hypothetical protein